ncbi:MAG: hypothetical protein LBQ28_05375 [Prevotellaceae bacterium]|jgi:hypothetical protein|nr:hypothetical protein [Prevotellaceae bacterium]
MNKKDLIILIPMYRLPFDADEQKSLNRTYSYLADYPMAFVKPQSLDVSDILKVYPKMQTESFPDHYFVNISGYNKLMLSEEFYERFLNYKYMLICQLDAYIFRKDINIWLQKGYDYIGAPWIVKPKYRRLYYRIFLKIKSIFYYLITKKPFLLTLLADKVGNGGLSLRKVQSFYQTIIDKKLIINEFIEKSKTNSGYNEDVFWASQQVKFRYPTAKEALRFAIEQYPEMCFELNNYELPFGCHAWNKEKYKKFWENKIN